MLRPESWTYLGLIDLREIWRYVEMDVWDKRTRTRRGYLVGNGRVRLPDSCRSSQAVWGVRRVKAAFSSGCKSHPASAPAGSYRSNCGGNETVEAFGKCLSRYTVRARVCRPQRE